jgi:hypothetical protein
MRIHIDIGGEGSTLNCPQDEAPPTGKGIRYFMIITDDATRFRWIYFLRTREIAEIAPCIEHLMRHLRNQGFNVVWVRSDQEFLTMKIQKICVKEGAKWEPTVADSPWQDGTSERSIGVILERARSSLFGARLPKQFWMEAMESAVYITNQLPTTVTLYNDPKPGGTTADKEIKPSPYCTPYSAWLNAPHNIKNIRKFGAYAWMHLHGPQEPVGKLIPVQSRYESLDSSDHIYTSMGP